MKNKALIALGIFCLLALSAGGCMGGQSKPQGFSGVVSYDGILYLGSTDGKIMAIDPSARDQDLSFPSSSSGEWPFTFTLPSKGTLCGSSSVPVVMYGTPVTANGMVCVGIYNGKVLMLNPLIRSQNLPFPQAKDGEWAYPRTDDTIEPIVGSPVVANDTVYVCSSDSRIYALDMAYGDEKWRSAPLDGKLWTTPLVDGATVYVATFDGHIYALSASDGSLLPWVFEAEVGFVSAPVLYGSTIFAGSFDRNLYAVKVGHDKPLWEFAGGNWFWAAPVVNGDIVYAGCLDGKLYAINGRSGGELWEFDAGSSIVSSPAMAGDLLVVTCESGDVYLVNAQTGDGRRINNPDDPQNAERPSIDASIKGHICVQDGIAYICAQNNYLYAVDIARGKISWKFPLEME